MNQLEEYSIKLERAQTQSLMRSQQLDDLNKQLARATELSNSLKEENEKQQKVSRQIIANHRDDKDEYMSEALINILNEVNQRNEEISP